MSDDTTTLFDGDFHMHIIKPLFTIVMKEFRPYFIGFCLLFLLMLSFHIYVIVRVESVFV